MLPEAAQNVLLEILNATNATLTQSASQTYEQEQSNSGNGFSPTGYGVVIGLAVVGTFLAGGLVYVVRTKEDHNNYQDIEKNDGSAPLPAHVTNISINSSSASTATVIHSQGRAPSQSGKKSTGSKGNKSTGSKGIPATLLNADTNLGRDDEFGYHNDKDEKSESTCTIS